MPFATLYDKGLEAYLDQERDDGAALWFFLHIPKTAGSSFGSEMASELQPDANIHIDYRRTGIPNEVQRQEAVDRFIAEMPAKSYRFASGHLRYPAVRRIADAHGNCRIITILRHPIGRVLSDYRYQCTPAHPPHEEFKIKFPTFESYVEHRTSQNKMYKFLCVNPKEPVSDLLRRMDWEFSFVGTLELYDLSFRLVTSLLGNPRDPKVYTRKTENNERNNIALSEDVVQRMKEVNAKDAEIFDHYQSILLNHQKDVSLGGEVSATGRAQNAQTGTGKRLAGAAGRA